VNLIDNTDDQPTPIKTVFEHLRDDTIAQLREGYHLVDIDYNDKLMDSQVDALVAGDFESLHDSVDENLRDHRWEGANYYIADEVHDVIAGWRAIDRIAQLHAAHDVGEPAGRGAITADLDEDEFDCEGAWQGYDDLWDSFEHTAEYEAVREAISERDNSNPARDLAHATPAVLMRHVVANEDTALYGNFTVTAVIKWMREHAEEGTVFKRNAHNIKVVQEVMAESMHSQAWSMGMLVYATDPGDLYDMPYDTEWVEIVNPYLYLGNYYQGDGYCSDEPLDAVFRVKRADLRTDRGAPGYGWNQVAGVYTSAYECEVRAVPVPEKKGSAA
jgi:hypothetical protein